MVFNDVHETLEYRKHSRHHPHFFGTVSLWEAHLWVLCSHKTESKLNEALLLLLYLKKVMESLHVTKTRNIFIKIITFKLNTASKMFPE